jgi:hypothetical protein
MEKMRVPWRREFDPGAEFVCRKPVTVGGRKFGPGETFDHTLLSTRRLRQLFDQHTIIFKGDTPGKMIRNFRRNPELDKVAPSTRNTVGAAVIAHREEHGRPTGLGQPEPKVKPQAEPPPFLEPLTPEEEEAARQAEVRAVRAAVPIPQDWEHQPWNAARALAKQLTDEAITNKEGALRVIAEEIAHRAAGPA